MTLRFIVSIMFLMAAVLLLISFSVSFIGGGPLIPLWYIILPVLLFGITQFFGPRVRCNLRLWYPQKVKRFERFEGWALVAFWIYYGAHLMFK